MVTPYLPYPPLSGGQTRSYHLITRLSKKHSITLCCYYRTEEEKRYAEKLKPYVKHIYLVKRRPVYHPLHFLYGLMTSKPFLLVSTYYSKELREIISGLLSKESFDLIHSETFYVMPNVPSTTVPIIVVEQTIEYHVYEHYIDSLPRFLHPLLRPELHKLLLWEKKMWQRAVRIITVSEEDKRAVILLDRRQQNKIDVVPNGTDTTALRQYKKTFNVKSPTFLYIGNFKWLQNVEAVDSLLTTYWPLLKQEFPHSRLIIAGRHIPKKFIQIRDDILFYESIPRVSTVYEQSDILIAPLYGPGGTRLKILEAMASRVAVATTPTGAMGLQLTDGKNVILFSSPPESVKKIARLLNQPTIKSLTDAAFHHVTTHYDWDAIVSQLEHTYNEHANCN